MPGNMRLHTRPNYEFPSDDTPPSTRPSSAASTSSTPNRSTSMDSLHTNSSTSDKPCGEEFIPTRLIRAAPKVNANAMQFVKTGPANLHKSAKEQMKKAEVVKSLRKTSLAEEEEWQSNSPAPNPPTSEESSDWQTNLDKWKSSRRKRNEDVLERVIEVKKYEKEEEYTKGRRKSKTFSEMREDKDKRGRRYNLVVHDTDNNDLADLGLNSGKVDGSSSQSDTAEDPDNRDLYNDNKDAKSDAGFCTGSDTGSDGVFAEDNISDTSSALGDKKDAHDSLLDSGPPLCSKDNTESLLTNGHISLISSKSMTSSLQTSEYTYDKAIEEYKQFAENSVKKRTPSLNSLSSNASLTKDDDKTSYRSQDLTKKIDDKLSYFHREIDRDKKSSIQEPRFMRREKGLKIDINKRRSMFELRDIDSETSDHKQTNRRSIDVSDKLKNKVMSFENVSESEKRARGVTPTRDTKFKEKLANFSHRNNLSSSTTSVNRKKAPERDQNFYKKLQSFTRMETEESNKSSKPSPVKTTPSRVTSEKTIPSWRLSERKISIEKKTQPKSVRPLKERIASFENLSPVEDSLRNREKSVSMECLNKRSITDEFKPINSSISVSNLYRRNSSTPYMVLEVDENTECEEIYTKSNASRDYLNSSAMESREPIKNSTLGSFEKMTNLLGSKTEDNIPPQGPPPKVPVSNSLRRSSPSPTRKSLSPTRSPSSTCIPSFPRGRSPSPTVSKVSLSPTRNSSACNLSNSPTTSRASPSSLLAGNTRSFSQTRLPQSDPIEIPPKGPRNRLPDSPPDIPDSSPPEIPKCPPPSFSSQRFSEINGSSFEVESLEMMEEFSHQTDAGIVDDPLLAEYGDDDIDEVIDNYEHLSESVTGEELPQDHFYETASEMGSLSRDHLMQDPYEENVYERIQEDEPMYENIYEKVNEFAEDENMESLDSPLDHQYQTLEEVKTEVENLTSPPLPPKNITPSCIEVLDVTWTDESNSPVLPPSVPPPPPPPDEDDFEDGTESEGSLPHLLSPSASALEKEELEPRPKTSAKQELRQKMSDFLGTQPHAQEELTLKPPPDVNEILRHERVDERLIVQKQQNQSRELPLMDFDPLMPQPYRPRYTWEDRMKADSAKPHDLDESSDQLDFQMKLEELEQEMEKHDREMLQRVKSSDPIEEEPKDQLVRSQTLPDSMMNLNLNESVDMDEYQSDHLHQLLEIERSFNLKNSKISNEQNYLTNISNISPPSQYGELPRMPPAQQIYSDRYCEGGNNSVLPLAPRHPYLPTQTESSVSLPIQEFYTAPVYNDQPSLVSNVDYQANSSYEEDSKSVQGNQFRNEESSCKESQQPRKQSILALSAIPKPRLTDNDSWIMKKKADASRKDYNKHWLFQEAEQRRLEQQDRISRVKPPVTDSSSMNILSNSLPASSSYQSHFQNMKSSFNQSSNTNFSSSMSNGSQSPSNVYSPSNVSNISPSPYTSPNTSSSSLIKPPRSTQVNNSPSKFSANYATSGQPLTSNGNTNGANNNWKKQTKTYQPDAPLPSNSSKPIPDSIINTLTQRVNNKKNTLTSSRNPVYKSNYRDDNYHDYMNTEFSSSPSNSSPTIPQGAIPQQQSSPGAEDQRLLSVSGKKKCSHCGEELGRGAAMIIESLRLFYHIPCFKCCVCGIQLGNGTSGADVRVRNHKLHCHNCYSNDEGMKFSKV